MEGVLRTLGDGLYTYTRPLAGFGGSVTGTLLVGQHEALVVDTLCSPEDTKIFLPLIGNRPVTVVYTHADWDHCLGTEALKPVRIIAHELTRKRLEEEGQTVLDRLLDSDSELVKGASIVLPGITFADTLRFRFSRGPNDFLEGKKGHENGLMIELVHVPGHTNDACCCHIPELGLLVAGDVVENPFPSVSSATDIGSWADRLEQWGRLVTRVIPGHGPVSGPGILVTNARYLRSLIGVARRNTPYPWLRPGVSLESLDPGMAAVVEKMDRGERAFYREVHKENVRRALLVL